MRIHLVISLLCPLLACCWTETGACISDNMCQAAGVGWTCGDDGKCRPPAGGMGDLAGVGTSDLPAPVPDLPAPVPDLAMRCPAGMVLISGRAFQMGTTGGKISESPVFLASVSDFCLDVTEVTVAAYSQCVKAKMSTGTGCDVPVG